MNLLSHKYLLGLFLLVMVTFLLGCTKPVQTLYPKEEPNQVEQRVADPTNCAEFKQRYGFVTCGDGECGMGEQEEELCSCPKDCDPYYSCNSDQDCTTTKPYCQLSKQYNKKICVGLSWIDGCDTDANCITPKPICNLGYCVSN